MNAKNDKTRPYFGMFNEVVMNNYTKVEINDESIYFATVFEDVDEGCATNILKAWWNEWDKQWEVEELFINNGKELEILINVLNKALTKVNAFEGE